MLAYTVERVLHIRAAGRSWLSAADVRKLLAEGRADDESHIERGVFHDRTMGWATKAMPRLPSDPLVRMRRLIDECPGCPADVPDADLYQQWLAHRAAAIGRVKTGRDASGRCRARVSLDVVIDRIMKRAVI